MTAMKASSAPVLRIDQAEPLAGNGEVRRAAVRQNSVSPCTIPKEFLRKFH